MDDVNRRVVSGDATRQLDGVRAGFAAAIGAERALLEQHHGAVAAADAAAIRHVLWGTLILVAAACAAGWLLDRSFEWPVQELRAKMGSVARGEVNVDVWITSHDEMGDVARSLEQIIASQKELAKAATRVAAGDVSVQVRARGDHDVLSQSFQQLQETTRELAAEMGGLIAAAKSGDLARRGAADKFQGAFRELVQGMNETLDAVVAPIAEALDVLRRVAARDLSARMRQDYAGDMARLKDSLNTAILNLDEALAQVATGAEQVSNASSQIAGASQSLAQGASEQASSLEEVSASVQELASTTKENAGNARQVQTLAEGARAGVAKDVESMRRLTEAMDRIKASSDATAKIVRTIDEIAFQTNLLALNAAVEAARAGDAGRGFAVVAEEVRNLAMRSAEAAKNTATLIEEAVGSVEGGVALNTEVLQGLESINRQINQVTEVVAHIAAASGQQARGVERISTAVEQMNGITRQTAASSEESASAAEELSSQAAVLMEMVGKFQLSLESPSAPRGHVRPEVPAPRVASAVARAARRKTTLKV